MFIGFLEEHYSQFTVYLATIKYIKQREKTPGVLSCLKLSVLQKRKHRKTALEQEESFSFSLKTTCAV